MNKKSYENAIKKLKSFNTLVFGGGGFKGLSYVGALNALRDKLGVDYGARTHKLENICGVSIGAFFGLLIVLGYNVTEISLVCQTLDPEKIFDINPIHLLHTSSLDDGKRMEEIIIKILEKKGFSKNATMDMIYKASDINFHVVITNISTMSVEHITSKTHGNFSLLEAMLSTMGLPLMFPARTNNPQRHVWVDGGILENFPMNRYPAESTLGFNFKWSIAPFLEGQQKDLFSYISRIIQTNQLPLEIMTWDALSIEHKSNTIVIDCETITALGKNNLVTFSINKSDREFLFIKAREAVENKIEDWEHGIPYLLETRDPGKYLSITRNLPIYLENAVTKKGSF
jgi:predicted acylesterase/phospholipase RssA